MTTSTAATETHRAARPAFLITIDTEGDNLWARRSVMTTENAGCLPRFQQLCEKYQLKPTWLTNWEMVESPGFRSFARDVIARRAGEIGMHLHAWDSPPLVPLTNDDQRLHPYLTHFSEAVMRDKIRVITDRLQDAFQTRMLSHRAGRWAFNETYARLLVEQGYRVDCSVTPNVRWVHGDLPGELDYRRFPDREYFLDLDEISRESSGSALLEVPMTILSQPPGLISGLATRALSLHRFGRRVAKRLFPEVRWMRPDGRNGSELVETLDLAIQQGRSYVEFMLHSSELMPGGSPRFPTVRHIESLYLDLETLFSAASQRCQGLTMAEFGERVREQRIHQAATRAA